jgi:hypothetical protein
MRAGRPARSAPISRSDFVVAAFAGHGDQAPRARRGGAPSAPY